MVADGADTAVISGCIRVIDATQAECGVELPTEIVVLETGQVVAVYAPPMPSVPYDDLEHFVDDYAQGRLSLDQVRARLRPTGARVTMTVSELEAIKEKAVAFYGSFAVRFTPKAAS